MTKGIGYNSWHIMSSVRRLLQSHHLFRPTTLCSSRQKHCLSFNPLPRIIRTLPNRHRPRSILVSHISRNASLTLLPIDFHMLSLLGKRSSQPHLYLTAWLHWYLGSYYYNKGIDGLILAKNTSLHSRNLDISQDRLIRSWSL